MMRMESDRLHERFERLRRIVHQWEQESKQYPKKALTLFDQGDLNGIEKLMNDKQQQLLMIQNLLLFIEKWDSSSLSSQRRQTD